jgi:hypothetical protein
MIALLVQLYLAVSGDASVEQALGYAFFLARLLSMTVLVTKQKKQ